MVKNRKVVKDPELHLMAFWHNMNKGINEERHKKLYHRVSECLSHLQKKSDSKQYKQVESLLINDFSPLIINFSALPKSLADKRTGNTTATELFIENYEMLTNRVETLTEQAFWDNIKDMRIQNKYIKNREL